MNNIFKITDLFLYYLYFKNIRKGHILYEKQFGLRQEHATSHDIIIIIIRRRIFIHTRSTQILITTVYTQLDNTNAKIIK